MLVAAWCVLPCAAIYAWLLLVDLVEETLISLGAPTEYAFETALCMCYLVNLQFWPWLISRLGGEL